MDKIVHVFGDSHTYGDGLDDCGFDQPWKEHSVQSWPYQIFDKSRIKNFSYPGCSNDTICLRLARHTTKNNIVLIMFTYPERLHMIKHGYNFVIGPNFSQSVSETGNENWVSKQIAEKEKEKDIRFIVDNFDDSFLEVLFLKNILWCQYFCESNNIEYYFTMVTHRHKNAMKQSLEKYRDGLYKNIKWNNFFLVDNKYGFADYGKHIGADRGNDGSHFGRKYHEEFGRIFLDWINNKKQV